MTGTGTQEDPYVVSTWDEFLTAIAQDGVYVNLAETYTWNLDEIYADSVIPSEIPIGYDTVVDGKNSIVTSTKVNYNTCDFSGTKATIKNLWFLRNKDTSFSGICIYLLDSASAILSLPTPGAFKCVYKFVPNLILDLDDEMYSITIKTYRGYEIYGNGLTIKNARDLQFSANMLNGFGGNTKIYNANIIDCLTVNRPPFAKNAAYFELYECNIKMVIDHAYLFQEHIYLYRSNLSLFFLTSAYGTFTGIYANDCNIYIYNTNITNQVSGSPVKFDNCYIGGEIPDSVLGNDVRIGGTNTICEIKTNKPIYAQTANHVVINKDLAPNKTSYISGMSFLTTEEIRNPQKLFDAGIPINPTGG